VNGVTKEKKFIHELS